MSPFLRWALPVGLLLAEYLTLSFMVDLPTSGPAMRLVEVVRLGTPIALGAVAAGWLLARGPRASSLDSSASPIAWRPYPALAAQLAVFAALASVANRTLREGAPPASTATLAVLLGGGALAIALALASAAPWRWLVASVVQRWRFPLIAVAVGVLSWRAAATVEGLWGVLSSSTLRATASLLRLGSGTVHLDSARNVVGLGGFLVNVAPVCSGVDGVGLVVLFQATWLSLARARLRFPHALLLLPAGILAALAANVVRIAALIAIGAAGHRRLAAGGLHSKFGWILFLAIALGTVAAAERASWFRRRGPGDVASGVPPGAAAYVAPLLAALATALVTSIFRDEGLDAWYGLRIVAAGAALLLLRRALPTPSLSWSWASVGLGVLVCAMWVAFGDAGPAGPPAALAALAPAARWAWIAIRVAGSCLMIPLIEELAFRGFLLRWLVSSDFERLPPRAWTWTAVIVSSAAFGAVHASWALGALAGVAFAAARLGRGRLADAVLAHAVANAGIAVAVLAFGRWGLWG